MTERLLKRLRQEFVKYPIVYILLFCILIAGFILRIYRTDSVLGFYFDQGRDALVIWDLWHSGKLFLVGPTTGIAGILRGPFYYYLIAPFYLLGGGNPVWPAVFLAFLTTIATGLAYYLGMSMHSRAAGLISAALASFSFSLVMAGRWLSNPTPMLLLSLILVWMMYLVTEGKRWAWVAIALVAGLSLFHFGSSGEFFYFPALAVFAIWQRKHLPNFKHLVYGLALFTATIMPLIIFDIRHELRLTNNIRGFLLEDGSFRGMTYYIFNERIKFYYQVFGGKLFHAKGVTELTIILSITAAFFAFLPKLLTRAGVKILLLLLTTPIIGLFFFQGNHGNIYDYYMTGYYLPFVLIVGILLGEIWSYKPGKIIVIIFFSFFMINNWEPIKYKIQDGADGPETILFANQKQAVEWVFEDAASREFNVDVYVPPVIPYSYDYLFKWMGTNSYNRIPETEQVELLYTLYEVDPPHPERLSAWLDRQKGIGMVEEEVKFGGITVQRRQRL